MESRESITVQEAVGTYIASVKKKGDHEELHRELFRFVQWCGTQRTWSEISPPEIGEYAEQMGASGTTPQAAARLQIVRGFLSYARRKGLTDKNLAQHVRIRKSKGTIFKGQEQEKIELTPEGHAHLVAELERLKSERGPIAIQIRKAAADKDVRENVPLEAAREQLGFLESRIRTIEYTLNAGVIIDASRQQRAQKVRLGARVSIKDLGTGRETSYTVVSPSEANPLDGRISDLSPLGKALIGRLSGQETEAETPRGKIRYRIMEVSA